MKERYPCEPSLFHQRMNRRRFLGLGAAAGAMLLLSDDTVERQSTMENVRFSPSRLGVNINTKNIRWLYGIEREREIVEKLMDLPVEHVRIPLHFDEVMAKPDQADFSTTDWIIEMALQKGKKIHLQMGLKTINWPEFHLPQWFVDRFPEVAQEHVQIGSQPERDAIIMQYLKACCKRYLKGKVKDSITSLHIENEALSRNLPVTTRSIHPELLDLEVAMVKRYAPDIPLVQNIPWDTPLAIPRVFGHNDIIGFNAYNQAQWQNPVARAALWTAIRTADFFAKRQNKLLYITEYQASPWLGGDKKPDYPYSLDEFKHGLSRLSAIQPDIIFLWGMDMHVGKENSQHVAYINTITKAA